MARIVKSRVKELVKQRGRSEAEAEELVELISGHSLRAGYATSAAARNMPAYRIQSHTRHKSAQMVTGYIREADEIRSRWGGLLTMMATLGHGNISTTSGYLHARPDDSSGLCLDPGVFLR